jgi:hypothetical protein
LNIPVLAMLWLHRTLTQAAITAGADAEVPGAVNVTLPGAKLQESPVLGGGGARHAEGRRASGMSPGPTLVAGTPGRIASLSWSSWTRLT